MKTLTFFFRTTLLLTLLIATSLTGSAYDFVYSGIYYKITSSTNMTVEVTYKSKTDNSYSGTITIPEKVTSDGKTYYVTAIGEYAFIGCTGLKKVNYASQRITTIGNYAFQGCNGITSFVVPTHITSIGNGVFNGCYGMTGLTIEESEETLSLGYNYYNTNGGKGLFYDCPLISVFIGRPLSYEAGYPRSGYSPFANNKTLVKAHFGNPVKSIQSYLFTGCSSLKTLVFNTQCKPTTIGDYAFWSCTALTESDINYPETVTTIGNGAFQACTSIISYTIPNRVTTIGNNAFSYCSGLSSIYFSNTVKTVGEYAFQNCTRLNNVVIKPSMNSIGNGAFNGCTAMTGVTIEESEETLSLGCNYYNTNGGKGLFYDCPLVSVFIGRPLSYEAGYPRSGYSPFAYNKTLVKAHFGNSVKTIQSYLFTGCSSLKTLVYNSQCRPTAIENFAFWGCTALTESDIHYPESVKTIGNNAFQDCSSISSYTIPDHVTAVGAGAFQSCTRLSNVVIKPSVTSVGNAAFNGCTALTGVTIEESEETLSLGWNYYTTNGGKGLFYDCPLISVFIGRPLSYEAGYPRSGYSPFGNNKTLVKVHFGNPVKTIQSYLFTGCSSLKTLVYNSQCRPTAIETDAFWGCTSLTESDIHYPESVKTIGNYAFQDCSSISSYSIPDHVTTIGEGAFMSCTRLAHLVIKPSVTSISNKAFNGCTAMTDVTIEESEETLSLGYNYYTTNGGKGLFYDCPLVSVFIGRPLSYEAGYPRSGYSPFANNLNLVKARLGKKLTSIPNYVFYGCTYLNEVTSCAATPPSANSNCFANYDARLYVPKNSVSAYKNANVWKDFSNITGVDVGNDDEPIVPGWLYGDVNGDGKVNITDVMELITYILTH